MRIRVWGAAVALFLAGCSRGAPSPTASASASSAASAGDASIAAISRDAAAEAAHEEDDATDPLEHWARVRWRAMGHPDIVYVPTPQKIVDRMLDVAKVKKDDVLYDLGCGDGRVVVTAAKRYGVHAVGFDIDPQRVAESRENVRASGLEDLVSIRWADVTMVDLSPASVVTIYLSPQVQRWLMTSLEKLGRGSRIVTHDYALPDAVPTARWRLQGPFFGRMNELYEAGVPEDRAHYQFTEHLLFLYVAPLVHE